MIPSFASSANDQLFKQYKQQLKKKENKSTHARSRTSLGPAATTASTAATSTATSAGVSNASSLRGTPARPGAVARPHLGHDDQSSMIVPPGLNLQSPAPVTPVRRISASTPSSVQPRRARLSPEEINVKWKEIFSVMERWASADDGTATPSKAACTYAAAARLQAAYEAELDKFERVREGYAIMVQQYIKLAQLAQAQALNGLKRGERRIVLPPHPAPPAAPTPPTITPFSPSIAAVDLEWRASLAADPSRLRGDALDHRALESRLMEFLHRDSHPLTAVKESFVSTFLCAYSVLHNPTLRGCTTNAASDLLLSNTLPTLLYFLDLLTRLLAKLFPELDTVRNPSTMESVRQSAMECIFPAIFPTLFALYKRKYFFRDAELASKMSVLATTGQGGCNITLEDLGVSRWFCLDERIVHEEIAKQRAKKRLREREKRKAAGETEAQADQREAEEDRLREAAVDAASHVDDSSVATHSSATPPTSTSPPTGSPTQPPQPQQLRLDNGVTITSLVSPPMIPRGNPSHSLQLSGSPEMNAPHPISQLTNGSNGSSHTSTPGRMIPTTRLSPVTGFDAGAGFDAASLGRSPRAEKIQDLLSRSPSRRTAGPQMPMPSPSSRSSRNVNANASVNGNGNGHGATSNMGTKSSPAPSKVDPASRQVVGFSALGDFGSPSSADSIPAAAEQSPSPAPAPTPMTTPASNASSLSLALKQLRTPVANGNSPGVLSPSRPIAPKPQPQLGFGAHTLGGFSSYLDSDSDDDGDHDSSSSSPRMGMPVPVLGSSMPMLQGLPSSMLTHTPGAGSELLKQEKKKQRRQRSTGGGDSFNNVPSSETPPPPHHLHPQQPFVLDTDRTLATSGGLDSDADLDADYDNDEASFPYQEAVVLLRRLTSERTPRDKLQCLIAVSQEVCWCVDRFYSRPCFTRIGFRPKPEDLCINADDLLSLVSFILIKSQLPNVISEAAFIDDFISRSMKLHMPGYFLATLQASIELCTKLDKQKFISRELAEQEAHAQAQAAASVGEATPRQAQRRPSYLQPATNGAPNGVTHAQPHLGLNASPLSPSSVASSSSSQRRNGLPVPPPILPSSRSTSSVTASAESLQRTGSFHSSPGSRVDALDERDALAKSASWNHDFQVSQGHFSQPPSPAAKPRSKLAQLVNTRQ